MNTKILIIDDDIELSSLLKECLKKDNILADITHNGVDGLKKILNFEYKLIVLDIMLPQMDGFEVLTQLRKTSEIPVLMLTARNDEIDKVSGLRLGADDYLTKPFSINEFIARVHSLIRRYTKFNVIKNTKSDLISHEDLIINKENRTVLIHNTVLNLTSKEFDILYLLASNTGKVFTKKQIYTSVWNDDYAFDDNNIMSYMSKLRKKLEVYELDKEYIQTVWGVGYRFNCGE